MWLDEARKVPVFEGVDRRRFEDEIGPAQQPAVLRGAVRDWPAVAAANRSPQALCDYLKSYANDRKVLFLSAKPEIAGRYSFSDDLKGFNHTQRQMPFAELAALLLRDADDPSAPTHYAGGVPVASIMPGVADDNPMTLLPPDKDRMISLWIGNRTRTAAHWDLPQNLACVIAGRRRFTLFPIAQIDNLYITPLDLTLAGQPTSLVDFHAPDFTLYPKFQDAMPHAMVADLEPGDVLYLPSLWFHHVEALDTFGAMMNFWWRDGAAHLTQTTPLLTLIHGLLTLRDMPYAERMRWRTLFDHYLFAPDGHDALAHIPADVQGMFGEMTPDIHQQIRSHLIKTLGGK